MAEWREIASFPGYSVSNTGLIRNDDTGRMLSRRVNQSGIANVGLTKNRVQYKRAVNLLVANALLTTRPHESFTTPINLDGDRLNNRVENLMWRPRWFASKYFDQFKKGSISFRNPLEESETHECFNTSWEAAIKYGLLDMEILSAVLNKTHVWPTKQYFRPIR